MGGAALVLGHILQVDGLLQEDLPLDPGPVVPLNSIDHLVGEVRSELWVTPEGGRGAAGIICLKHA